MMKRILSLLFAILMVVSVFPASAYAAVLEEIVTEPVALVDGSDGEETDPMVGKIVTLVESPGLLQAVENPKVSTAGTIVGTGAFPRYMQIEAVETVGSITYYKLKAAETANNTWPDYFGTSYEHCWLPSTQVTQTELPKPCPFCGEYGCTTVHKQCSICGGMDCKVIHFWCAYCEKYDCGNSHPYCPACDGNVVDCDKTHIWCRYCNAYDCGKTHEDPFKPATAPVIPSNPTLTPGAEVSVVDGAGNAVTAEGLVLYEGTKTSLSAWSELEGDVSYQWQVCYNNADMLWADIYGQTGKGILASPAMFLNIIDYQAITYLRCVATSGNEVRTSAAIPITVHEALPVQTTVLQRETLLTANGGNADAQQVSDTGDEVKYSVTVAFVFDMGDNGIQEDAADSWVASISAGEDFILDIPAPKVAGYAPSFGGVDNVERITATVTNIQSDVRYTVIYKPDYVDFQIYHHWQQLASNDYDIHEIQTVSGLKTGQQVGEGLQRTYEGFKAMPYDTTITVAADGSTVVNIYYDREYYMVRLNLAGGHGAEPVYVRYETPVAAVISNPQRTGYTFAGWTPELPANMPAWHTDHTAQWTKAETFYTVAFMYENANPEADGNYGYTFVGSTRKKGITGTSVSGTLQDYETASFAGKDATNFKRLNEDKTDKNVTIKADGTTVVYVYIYRESYRLTYYMWKCLHTHTSACCNLYHTSHSDSCCSIPYHVNHTTGCVTNEIKKGTTYIPESDLNDAVPNRYNGVSIAYKYLGQTRYYVWFDGSWYRTADGNNGKDPLNWNCCRAGRGQYTHDHTSGCTCTMYHDHSSGCNSSGCTHTASWHCESDTTNQDHWIPVYSEYLKYEADTDLIHWNMLGMGDGVPGLASGEYGLRWIPQKYGGFAHWNGDNAGNGTAVGAFTSMTSGDVNFYQGGTGSNQYEIQYWLEGADGTGSRSYTKDGDTRYFNAGTLFKNQMGNVAWIDEFQHGTPLGFEQFQATYGSTQGADTFILAENSRQSAYKYNNFYYIRKVYKIEYRNGETSVTTRDMRYEQPLTSEFNLDGNSLGMKSPYGDGYVFGGWYMDPDGTIPAKFDGSTIMPNAGEKGTIGLALYAKWEPVTHVVRTYLTKGGNQLGYYEVLHGEVVANTPATPVNGKLEFISWFYEEDGEKKAYNFTMPVYKDMELFAEWSDIVTVKGTIRYCIKDANGNDIEIGGSTSVTGNVGVTKTFEAKIGTALNSGYTSGYFPNEVSHNIEFSANESQNVYTFYYTEREAVNYTVHFVNKDDHTDHIATTITGSTKSSSIEIVLNELENYDPRDDWHPDANSKKFVLSSEDSRNVFYFYYTYDDQKATVQVEHYIQNTAGTGYTHYYTEPAVLVEIGTTVTATSLSLTGFTYNGAVSTNGLELTEDGLILKLYYDRNTYGYTFRFVYTDADGNQVEFPNSTVTGTGLYGASAVQTAKTFLGYKRTAATAGSQTVTISNNTGNNVRTFYYEEDSVTIRYQVGAVQGGTVSNAAETVLVVTGTPSGSTAAAKEDYVFRGWYTTYACTGTAISTDANFEPSKNADGVYEAKTYYAKFEEVKVTIHYAVQMPESAGTAATLTKASEQVSVLSGEAVGSAVDTVPEKYEFAGWYDANGAKVGNSASFVPTMDGDKWVDGTTYTAKFAEKKAAINYVAVGNGTVSPTTEEVDMVTGEAAGTTATATEHIARFVGWYDNEACTGEALSTKAAFAPDTPAGGWAENQTYYAKFENIRYTVSFDTNGGTPATIESVTYAYGDSLTLPAVENGNYTVTWTVKENAGDWVKDSEVNNGTVNHYGDVTLVANWTIDAIWIDWDFNIFTSGEDDILYRLFNVPFGTELVYAGALTTDELAERRNSPEYTYTFKEWVEVDLSQYEDLLSNEIKGIVVYQASYEETANGYTITYYLRDGSLGEGITNPETYTAETETFTLHNPTRAGYEFMGWATTPDATTGEQTVTVAQGTTGDLTYYALWERAFADLTVTVTNGRTDHTYIYVITSTTNADFTPIRVVLTESNGFSATVRQLPVGDYQVQEVDAWSWRESAIAAQTVTVDTSKTVNFVYNTVLLNPNWLSGYSYHVRRKDGNG